MCSDMCACCMSRTTAEGKSCIITWASPARHLRFICIESELMFGRYTFYYCQTFHNPRIHLCRFKKLETGCYCSISGMHVGTTGWLGVVHIHLTSGSMLMELGFDHVRKRREEVPSRWLSSSTLVPILHWMRGKKSP